MNIDEQIAKEYLESKGFLSVYEPDGNIPPDFSVNGNIGVEVRRLNQSHDGRSKSQGLEEVSISLERMVNGIFEDFPKQDGQEGYWVELEYRRPVKKISSMRSSVRAVLDEFLRGSRELPARLHVTPNLVLNVLCSSAATANQFDLGVVMDDDVGGWTVSIYSTEIERCIVEKTRKIGEYHSAYKNWWLLLIDHIGMLVGDDVSKLLKSITKRSSWDRIIVLDRTGVETGLEI